MDTFSSFIYKYITFRNRPCSHLIYRCCPPPAQSTGKFCGQPQGCSYLNSCARSDHLVPFKWQEVIEIMIASHVCFFTEGRVARDLRLRASVATIVVCGITSFVCFDLDPSWSPVVFPLEFWSSLKGRSSSRDLIRGRRALPLANWSPTRNQIDLIFWSYPSENTLKESVVFVGSHLKSPEVKQGKPWKKNTIFQDMMIDTFQTW